MKQFTTFVFEFDEAGVLTHHTDFRGAPLVLFYSSNRREEVN